MSTSATHRGGFEERTWRPRSRHSRAYRRARYAAQRRADFYEELFKFAVVTFLLLLFVRPLGVIVGLVWGLKLCRRYSDLHVMPKLRRRWLREELRSYGHAYRGEEDDERDPDAVARSLLEGLGDDPDSAENLRRARAALKRAEMLGQESAERRQLRMDEVVDRALCSVGPRLARAGIEVRREVDSVGVLWGDPVVLERVVTQLLESAVDALESARPSRPRLEVLMGENLAGTEVWVRVRHNGPPVETEQLSEITRPFYVPGGDLSGSEFRLTLDKSAGGSNGVAA